MFREQRDDLGKNKRATENSCSRLGQIFYYAQEKKPGLSPWQLSANYRLCWEFIRECRDKCGATATTPLTYAKDLVCVCEYTRERWSRHPDVPKTSTFLDDIKDAHVYWKDKQAAFGKEITQDQNKKFATGSVRVADFDKLHEYLEDAEENQLLEEAFVRLEAAVRLQQGNQAHKLTWSLGIG